jgi:hypothetical protein
MDRKCCQRQIYYNDRFKKKNKNDYIPNVFTTSLIAI